MFTYEGILQKGGPEESAGGARRSATRLCSAPLGLGSCLRFYDNILPLGISDAVQHLIGRILDTSIGTMKLPRRLGSQLAKHVTITQRMNCLEYEIGPHSFFS
jgi:hypothetical protein